MTSNESGSPWQPPDVGDAPASQQPSAPRLPDRPTVPPSAQGPTSPPMISAPGAASNRPAAPPLGEMSFGDEPPGPSGKARSKIGIGGAVLGVLALGAAGVFAAAQIVGDNDGGADSPEAVGLSMMESIEQEDVLGMIDLLLPGERETFREPMVELVSELTRLDVLSEQASLAELSGLDIEFSNESVSVADTNAGDISNITMTADGTATIDGEQLPIGDFIFDTAEEVGGEAIDMGSMDVVSEADLDVTMTVVEEDGRWYLSLFHSIAEAARRDLGVDIPAEPVAVRGGESPEGAIDVLLDGVEQFDLAKIIGAINPNEAQALQRYAPIFLDDAEAMLADVPLSWQVTGTEYEVAGSGSERFVTITSLRLDGEAEGERFSMVLEGECVVVTVGDEHFDSCETATDTFDLDEIFADAQPLQDLVDQVEATFADYDAPGITVQQVDGEWFVSPIGAAFDQLLAVFAALDREELDGLVDQVEQTIGFFADEFGGLGDLVMGEDFSEAFPLDEEPLIVDGDESDFFDDDSSSVPDEDQYEDWDRIQRGCLDRGEPAEVAQCLKDEIAAGTLPDFYLSVELEFVECGLGPIATGQVQQFEQTDEEYTEMATAAAECFAALVENGEIEDFDVPAEYVRVECAEGRNPWNFDSDEEFFDRWLDCIYG